MSSSSLHDPAVSTIPETVQSPPPAVMDSVAGRASGLWPWLRHAAPTIAVIGLLAGLALWGHRNDWRLPKFSTLVGTPPKKELTWCEEHGVPESQCVECNRDLMPKRPDHGWCSEHGVHNCPLCHPDVAELKDKPIVTDADRRRAKMALALQPRKSNNDKCKFYQRRIQFASFEAVKKAGLDVEPAERQPVSEWVAGNGEITYDQSRFANLSSRVAGTIWRVEKKIGDRVRAGEVLAIVDAMTIGQMKSELIDALVQDALQKKNYERLHGLGEGVVAGRQVLESEAAYDKSQTHVLAAQQALANVGLVVDLGALRALPREEQIAQLRLLGVEDAIASNERNGIVTANLSPIRSPMDGVVVDRQVVAGEVVDASRILFRIADTSRMWLTLSLPLEEAGKLSLGLPVRFRPDGGQEEVTGKLDWISTAADSKTRMIKARAELPNPAGRLRDETFGSGQIILRDESQAIVVPTEAVHWEGCCHIVFVRNKQYFDSPESPKVFSVRSVRIGAANSKGTEIIAGVLPGEVVATKGSGVLRAQLLKNNLGEGCTCGH